MTAHGLRHDDQPECGAAAQAQRRSRLHLSLVDGQDAGAHDLGDEWRRCRSTSANARATNSGMIREPPAKLKPLSCGSSKVKGRPNTRIVTSGSPNRRPSA